MNLLMYVCMNACIGACVRACLSLSVCMFAYIKVGLCACMSVCSRMFAYGCFHDAPIQRKGAHIKGMACPQGESDTPPRAKPSIDPQ